VGKKYNNTFYEIGGLFVGQLVSFEDLKALVKEIKDTFIFF